MLGITLGFWEKISVFEYLFFNILSLLWRFISLVTLIFLISCQRNPIDRTEFNVDKDPLRIIVKENISKIREKVGWR